MYSQGNENNLKEISTSVWPLTWYVWYGRTTYDYYSNPLFIDQLFFSVLGSKIKKAKGERGKDYSKPSKQKKTEQNEQTDNLVESTISAQEVELENMVDKLNVLHSEYFLKIKDKSEPGQDVKEQLCTTVGQQLIRIIDWAKKLPGYCQLAISDQAILLQAAWVDLLVLNWLYFSVVSEGGLNISKSCHITKEDAKELGFDNIYSHIVLLIDRAKKYRIDEEEVACLKAISLTNAGM